MEGHVLAKRYPVNDFSTDIPPPKPRLHRVPTDSFRGTPQKTNQVLSTMTVLTNDVPTQQSSQLPNNAGDAEFQRQQSTVAAEPRREVHPGWKT